METLTVQAVQSAYSMTDPNPSELAESLRKWLEAGHLNDPKAIPQTIDIAQMKRKAAQRIMAAQRAAANYDEDKDDSEG